MSKYEAEQKACAGSNGKIATPPRRSPPKLSPSQGVKTVPGEKRGQDKG